jgi:hypothetical protein
MITFDSEMQKLPPERRSRIEAKTQELLTIVRTPFEKKNGRRDKKSNSSLKVQVETKYKMNCSMDIVQNLLTKVGNLANRNNRAQTHPRRETNS